MKNTRVSLRYAGALMTAAEEGKTIDGIGKDLDTLARVLNASPDLRRMLASPVVPPDKKIAVFRELFRGNLGNGTMEFLEFLVTKNREAHLAGIIEEFRALRDEKLGIVSVDVTSAVEFTPSQEKDLQNELERYTRKKVRVRIAVDAAIKGGLVVRVGDTVLDASIRRQLEILRERFITDRPLSN